MCLFIKMGEKLSWEIISSISDVSFHVFSQLSAEGLWQCWAGVWSWEHPAPKTSPHSKVQLFPPAWKLGLEWSWHSRRDESIPESMGRGANLWKSLQTRSRAAAKSGAAASDGLHWYSGGSRAGDCTKLFSNRNYNWQGKKKKFKIKKREMERNLGAFVS